MNEYDDLREKLAHKIYEIRIKAQKNSEYTTSALYDEVEHLCENVLDPGDEYFIDLYNEYDYSKQQIKEVHEYQEGFMHQPKHHQEECYEYADEIMKIIQEEGGK